jgi:flagellin FlaB
MKRWTRIRRDKRADIGIGTMIVFIAMILVSAVAAGVLISTANSVREQATSTGDQAINNVAAGFNRVAVVGYVALDDNHLNSINVTLRLAAGSPNVYMKNVAVKLNFGSVDNTLTWAATPDADHFSTNIKFEVSSGAFATDFTLKQGDMVSIQVGGAGYDLDLDNFKEVKIDIIPGFGQGTFIDIVTPEVYLGTYVNLA